jgi:HJR/Mrr/RecB family endonuclease
MYFPYIDDHLLTIILALIDDFHHIVHLNETNHLFKKKYLKKLQDNNQLNL